MMGTNFTDLATVEPLVAATLNDRLDELDQALTGDTVPETLDMLVTAGETLAARNVVYVATDAVGGDTPGRAYKADADMAIESSRAFAVGLMIEAATAGNTGRCRIMGILGGFSSLTPGAPQYVSVTAGGITETAPKNVWMMGIAISATQVLVNNRGSQALSKQVANFGYFAGGFTSAYVATADRITFNTGATAANTVSNLSAAKSSLAGVSDSEVYGYFAGGDTGAAVATADRLTFSSGATAANTVSNLSQARYWLTAVSDGGTYGYFAGGDTGAVVATADRFTFSSGAMAANTVSNLSQAKRYLAGVSDVGTYGYFAGGTTTTGFDYVVTADRITFSSGAMAANTVSNLSQARYGLAGMGDSLNGYFAGGSSSGLSVITDRLVYSTGITVANTVSNLSQARSTLAGVSDGGNYGYFAGGLTGGAAVTADRLTFSTGATAANTVSNLSQGRFGLAALADFFV